MKRWLTSLLTLLLPTLAQAVAYDLPGNMPPGCSRNGSNYTCPGGGDLQHGDTVTVSSPKPATMTITGSIGTNNAQINWGGNASDLQVIVQGTLTLGYQARIKANITANAINDAGGGQVIIVGNLTANNNGNITLADSANVTGNLVTSGSGTITTGRAGTITGNVTGGSGTITVSETGRVTGNVTGSGTVTVVQQAIVDGNLNAGSGAVNLGFQSRVNGNLATTGAITTGQESRVGGTITGGAGNVSVGYGATVVGALSTTSGTIGFAQNAVAQACVRSTSSASITLGYQSNINSVCCSNSCSSSCVVNNSTYAMPPLCTPAGPAIASFAIAGTGSASTCSPQMLTITARNSSGTTLTGYTGTITLTTSTAAGTWSAGSGPAPAGTLSAGANNGQATYTFAAGDAGVVKLRLAHNSAQNVTVNVRDNAVASTLSTSTAINYRDNAFVLEEDVGNLINGSSMVAVAGRPHDMRVSLYKKDPTTGNCSIANDYNGSRNLKLWRTDSGGPWTPPLIVSTDIPTAKPGATNLSVSFTSGVGSFNINTSNIGKYAFTLEDDSLSYASSTISGGIGNITVRPFALAITGLTLSGTNNPNGSAVADGIFGKAGAPFSATVTAYRWNSSADGTNNDGVPTANLPLSQISAGGVASSFNSALSLNILGGSTTPSPGVEGTLANNVIASTSFANGVGSTSALTYSEVGSFALNPAGVVSDYLSSGLTLDALVFNSAGNQNTRVGRFTPAGFALTVGATPIVHRVDMSCSPSASTFTYLDEFLRLDFTLTAQNATGGTTANYRDTFARLNLGTAANLKLSGIDGSTTFKTANARLELDAVTGSWTAGVATVTLKARARRAAAPDGPFNASFGIAPVDLDNIGMMTLDLDTDSPANGNDSVRVGSAIPLRYGRVRLQNALGVANRPLHLPLVAQFWNGTAFITNALDSCTRITDTNLSFGNLRNVAVGDAKMVGTTSQIAAGTGRITLAAPGVARGTYDVALALDGATPPTDVSCLKTVSAWVPAKAATTGANLPALRGAWCGSAATSDPSARATWGLYRGADGVLYQRENY